MSAWELRTWWQADVVELRADALSASPEELASFGRTLERAGIEALVLRDSAPDGATADLDAVLVAAAVAAATTELLLVVPLRLPDGVPFSAARRVAALDGLSGGRAATLPSPGATPPDEAAEYLAVCTGLWSGWDPDALVQDRRSGIFADPARVAALHHEGVHFRVPGPLTAPATAQGVPVLVADAGDPWPDVTWADVVLDGPPGRPGALRLDTVPADVGASALAARAADDRPGVVVAGGWRRATLQDFCAAVLEPLRAGRTAPVPRSARSRVFPAAPVRRS